MDIKQYTYHDEKNNNNKRLNVSLLGSGENVYLPKAGTFPTVSFLGVLI